VKEAAEEAAVTSKAELASALPTRTIERNVKKMDDVDSCVDACQLTSLQRKAAQAERLGMGMGTV